MRILLITTIIQYGHAYSMYDLNNNARTWEFSGNVLLVLSSRNIHFECHLSNVLSRIMNLLNDLLNL